MGRKGLRKDAHGFTLVEVMVTIIVMGIVLAIASTSWFNVVEGRRVDSATNQLASDLRLAHTKATNRLANHSIVVAAPGSPTYQIGRTGGTFATRTLPGGTEIVAATTIVFKSNGEATVTSGAGSPITVRSSNDNTENHTIEFDTATSRIKIVP